MSATGDQQEPYTTNSLGGNDVALVLAPEKPQLPAANANAEMRHDYELAERVGTIEAWDSFVAAHPTGFYADLAKAQRNKLAAETARLQATERARLAAEEQARLAAEGAKAAAQAKAAQQAKEAEAAQLAAEKKERDEEARVAAAEAVKQAEQQRLAAEEAARLERAKVAAVEQPKAADQAPATKPAAPTNAALSPEDAKPSPQPTDLPRQLQAELKRVGCKSGDIDDNWSTSARKALSSFNDSAGTKFDVKLASIDALDAVRAKQGRVCPLECERGFRASGDHCVKIVCDAGEVLGPNGVCRARPERAPKAVARSRAHGSASGGRRCFVYNGSSFCE
jgi:chemotaxis protein histidine kinase CheA